MSIQGCGRSFLSVPLLALLGGTLPFASAHAAGRGDEAAKALAPLVAHDACARGWLAFAEGDAETGTEQFKTAVKLDAKHAGAAFALGLAQYFQGDFPGATESFRKAIEADRTAFAPRLGLFYALYELDRRDEAREALHAAILADLDHEQCRNSAWTTYAILGGDPAQAAAAHESKYAKDQTNALAVFLHANALHAQNNIETAREEWKLALELDPKLAAAPFAASDVESDDSPERLALLERAIGLGLDSTTAQAFRGWSMQLQGRHDAAAAAYRKSTSFDSGTWRGHRSLGMLLALQAKQDEAAIELTAFERESVQPILLYGTWSATAEQAEEHWRSATADAPAAWLPWALRGNALAELGDLESAIACERKAVALAESQPLAHLFLGVMLERTDLPAAKRSLMRALELDPKLKCVELELAALALASDPKAAEVRLTKLLAADPTSEVLLAHRAKARMASNDVAGAIQDCATALRRAVPSVLVLKLSSLARARLGDFDGQFRDLTRALQIDGTDAEALVLRAQLRAAHDDAAGAVQDFYAAWLSAPQSQFGLAALTHLGQLRALEPCMNCSGSGQTSCGNCSNSGWRMCNYCNGQPRRYDGTECSWCKFTGRPGYQRCNVCYGNGRQRCLSCSGMGQRLR
jgi:tetratricopeptide (TPR) repeat protein